MKYRHYWILALIFSLNHLCSCTRNEEPVSSYESEEPIEYTWIENEDYTMENLDDPETFKDYRLQFCWVPPDEKDIHNKSIWTVKLNGTDMQKVMTEELLHRKGRNIMDAPARSPDNRYILIRMDGGNNHLNRNLFDLKTKTVQTLTTGGVVPFPTWSPDSRFVYFYADAHLWRYDVQDKILKENFWIPSQGFYVLKNGSFLSLLNEEYRRYDSLGKMTNSVPLTYGIDQYHSLSLDEQLLLFSDFKHCYVLSINHDNTIAYQDDEPKRFVAIGPENKYFFYAKRTKIWKINIETKEKSLVLDLSIGCDNCGSLVSYLTLLKPIRNNHGNACR